MALQESEFEHGSIVDFEVTVAATFARMKKIMTGALWFFIFLEEILCFMFASSLFTGNRETGERERENEGARDVCFATTKTKNMGFSAVGVGGLGENLKTQPQEIMGFFSWFSI